MFRPRAEEILITHLDVDPWEAARLVGAIEGAGVRVVDWRGDWVRRHRLFDALGLLAYCGGFVGLFVAIALAPDHPSSVLSFAAFGVAIGAFCVGFAIDFLPWKTERGDYAPLARSVDLG